MADGKVALPLANDKDGVEVLDRVTSIENLTFYGNRTLPIQARLSDFMILMQGSNSIAKLYINDTSHGPRFC